MAGCLVHPASVHVLDAISACLVAAGSDAWWKGFGLEVETLTSLEPNGFASVLKTVQAPHHTSLW